ncbi:Zona pellucida-like domain [Popillia japonica]|uniref:Zona pellucida-like domain n=1 Tax=Popillia japonica TaxID=7064 RepID=A0AAW1ICU0_POPJA
MCPNHPFVLALLTVALIYANTAVNAANIPIPTTSVPEVESDVRVDCNNDEIVVSITTKSGVFNGMIYPAGLTKSSPCFGEWIKTGVPVKYKLPLRACNTMSMELDDGGIEYFNTIVVQPHLKLVTNQGRSFHIRCRYNTRNNTVTINDLGGPKLE